MTSPHEPYCDQRHTPRQRCNDELRGTGIVVETPGPEAESGDTLSDSASDRSEQPTAPPPVIEDAATATAANDIAVAANAMRTTTYAGVEWQKTVAALERPAQVPSPTPSPRAEEPGRRIPAKAIVAAVALASTAALALILRRGSTVEAPGED